MVLEKTHEIDCVLCPKNAAEEQKGEGKSSEVSRRDLHILN